MFSIKGGEMETVITIATVAIAICAITSFALAWSIKQRDKENRQQTSDLFQAIVISNILSNTEATFGSAHLDDKIKLFKEFYIGQTTIYLTEKNEGK